jgi:hypothetical protein
VKLLARRETRWRANGVGHPTHLPDVSCGDSKRSSKPSKHHKKEIRNRHPASGGLDVARPYGSIKITFRQKMRLSASRATSRVNMAELKELQSVLHVRSLESVYSCGETLSEEQRGLNLFS